MTEPNWHEAQRAYATNARNRVADLRDRPAANPGVVAKHRDQLAERRDAHRRELDVSATLPQAGAATEARGRVAEARNAEARDAEGHREHAGAKATAPTLTPRPTPKPTQEVDIRAVPADVVQAARDAFNGRAPGTRIAYLVYDSLTDGDRRFSDRSDVRRLRFGDDHWGLEMSVRGEGDLLTLGLRSTPGDKLLIQVRHGGEPLHGVADQQATASVAEVQPGLVSLLVDSIDSPVNRRWQTSWVRL